VSPAARRTRPSRRPAAVEDRKGQAARRAVQRYALLAQGAGPDRRARLPYAVITPAALLNDYHPIDKDKPSIPADIKPGDKVFGPVAAAKVLECAPQGDGTFHTCLDLGGTTACPDTVCSNLHEGDLVALQHQLRLHLHACRPARRAARVPALHRRRHLRPA